MTSTRNRAAERMRRKRENEKAGLTHVSMWVPHTAVEDMHDLIDRDGLDPAGVFEFAMKAAKDLPPPFTRNVGRPLLR
jgi:hypothetical protein